MALSRSKRSASTLVGLDRRPMKGRTVRGVRAATGKQKQRIGRRVRLALTHPARPLGKPWPRSSWRAFDLRGNMGWGTLLRKVCKARGWSVSDPCRNDTKSKTVFLDEYEAMLLQKTPEQAFGRRGAVQDGYRLKRRPLPRHALWLQSSVEYRLPGANRRYVYRTDFGKLMAKHYRNLPGECGDYRNLGFPGVDVALVKTSFSKFFRNASWYPETFVMPGQLNALRRRLAERPHEHWITKPRNECAGAGICVWRADDPELVAHLSQSRKPSVVQQYVANPLLLGGYKFHLRIHVFVASLSPPEAYVQAGGQCLCSTKPFSLSSKTLGDDFDPPVHISNTGLNTKPAQFESFLKDKPVIGRGQQILMSQMEEHLAKERPGFDRELLWSQILQLTKELILYLGQAPSVRKYGRIKPGLFFDILGMDLIVDNKLKVWMCETNDTPCLNDQNREINGKPNPDYKKEGQALSQVWHDTFTLLGLDAGHPRGTLKGWYNIDFST